MENNLNSKLGMKNKVGYLIGGFPLTTMNVLLAVTLTYFYTNVLGIGLAAVSTIMLVSRVLDGISDAIGGVVVERTKSKHGKARAWILRMTIPYSAAMVLLYTVPASGSDMLKYVYIFLTYNFANTIVYTMSTIAITALTSLMTRDSKERTSLNMWRQFGASSMEIIITAVTIPAAVAAGGDQKAWIMVIGAEALLMLVCNFLCFKLTKELPPEAFGADSEEKTPFFTAVKSFVTNKYWWIILFVWGMCIYYMTFSGSVTSYYCQYMLGNVSLSSPILTSEKVGILVGLVTITPIMAKRMTKRNMMIVGAAVSILAQILIVINPVNVTLAVVAGVIRGMGIAPIFGTLTATIADSIEYSHWKSGIRAEGIGYAACTLGQKFNGGIALAIFGWVTAATGFDGTLEVQSAATEVALKGIYVYVPFIFFAIIIILISFSNLEKKIPKLLEEIKAGRVGGKREAL